jgi:hypothetical protein
MDAEKLIAFVKSKGYTEVKVNLFNNSFEVCCSSPEYSINHHYEFPISKLPSKPDGSKIYEQLMKDFPSVYDEIEL